MKILELFSGTQSISKVFRAHGWESYTVEYDPYFGAITDYVGDVRDITAEFILKEFGKPDVIWASPPCWSFSVASIQYHWKGGKQAYVPKSDSAYVSRQLVNHTLKLIRELQPKYWFIENPRGVLRKMPFMQEINQYRHTVTYCQYGDFRQKATDLWTNHPSPNFKPACKNGDSCHEAAPRGSKRGTQSITDSKAAAVIPRKLCEHIYSICN
jgi:site-specific DNA-cytosine methylase